jgi:succinyl-diaminopimelate desuccinylase
MLNLACELISRASLSPQDAGCQNLIAQLLAKAGFSIEHLPYAGVSNLWATHGKGPPILALVGHTDVVPAGDLKAWTFPPFQPTIDQGFLYGRGAADMKGNLATMLDASIAFTQAKPNHSGTLAWLITSDEEGRARHGIRQVAQYLKHTQQIPRWALVGEPSSEQTLADTLKIGRRGSLHGYLTFYGQQGHIAYPKLANNPIHHALPILQALTSHRWQDATSHFAETSLQLSTLDVANTATNVIPGQMSCHFNLRFSPQLGLSTIKKVIRGYLNQASVPTQLKWKLSGMPFYTPAQDPLVVQLQQIIQQHTQISPKLSTDGGTSDARFLAPLGTRCVELGPKNATIHQVNEHIKISDLERLYPIYIDLMHALLT